ncbi:LLM class flavin-dependent oxidoreductase [Rhodococcus sp. KBS0724]|uniref:LLM class flavin-dependent oxidoreductase n=1 Tax=Rhodococcus sp. KBS0724 TaxID=1179674 RepID=UPI00110D9587|nr:LLM class flavin-dependent oxidoreductase [Rhodococcus sp. KBS0724]TSD48795.1 LLM class flavin-dependent oxidoreductase [Rhodococcus sp. KBS0724]
MSEHNSAAFLIGLEFAGTGVHPHSWRRQDSRAEEVFTSSYWVDLVTAADRAGVDLAFFPDSFALQTQGQHATRGRLEAVATAARLSAVTSRIGLVPTATVTHTEPFHISKAIASIDFSSSGRAGWQVAVSDTDEASALFGRKAVQSAPSLWEEASEAVTVVSRLWDSWEDDAEIRDVPTGRFIDRDKLHYIDFEGKNFSVKGPSITPRSPQGQPLIVVDASRPEARELATERADLIRISAADLSEAQATARLVHEHAARIGRTVRVLLDVDVLLGADRAAADDALAELEEWAGVPYTLHSVFYRGDAAGLTTLLREISGSAGLDGVVLRPLALASGVQKIVTTVLPAFNPRPNLAPTLRERLGFELPVNQFA